jgi:hypothetical protein
LASLPSTIRHGQNEHREKAIHDKTLADKLHQENTFPDWTVTCAFYCALHCVDAYAHKLGIRSFEPGLDENTNAHLKRARFVERNLRDLFGSYQSLRSHCEQCRYDPQYFRLMSKTVPATMLKLADKFLLLLPK